MSITDRLEEIQARAEKATDGPWEWESTTPSMSGAHWNLRVTGKPGIRLSVTEYQHGPDNAEFIAHAREDVPWLIEQVRKRDAALRAVLDVCEKSEMGSYPEPKYDEYVPGQLDTTERVRAAIASALGVA